MTRQKAELRCLVLALAACGGVSGAQAGTVVPRVSLMQSWTDNLRLDDRNKDAALITTLSPGISIASNNGFVRGNLDYSLNGIVYTKTDQPSRVTNSLAATGQVELLPGQLFVDARAGIGQQNASAFGQQSVPTPTSQGGIANLANANQHETGTLAVTPRLTGALGGLLAYELRADFTRTEARGTSLGDSRGDAVSLNLSQRNVKQLGWWFSGTTQRMRSDVSSNRNDSMRVGLNYLPDPDWRFSANVGQERNDILDGEARSSATSGVSADWTPSNRTRLGADWQKHRYGNSHSMRLEHRMMRSVWTFSDVRSTTAGFAGSSAGVRTNYDLLYLLYTSRFPDPVERDAEVRKELLRQGLSPDAPSGGGVLSSGPSQVRSRQLGVLLQGVKSTLSAQFTRSITSRVGNNTNLGDLAQSSRIGQRSLTLTASHQLTPQSGLSLTALRQETDGDLTSQSTRFTSLMVNWNMRLGARIDAQLGARHSRFEGVTPYTENGAYANLMLSF